jgi:predicted metal-dependent phosphoesterase TrpH
LGCKSGNIDLHVHSTASDGSLKPLEILALAQKIGLGALALTDHDSIEGTKEILRSGVPESFGFLTGVEISARPPQSFTLSGTFHILGYGIDVDDPTLNSILETQQAARKNRNPKIIQQLNSLGIDLSLDEVIAASGKAQIGRPHIGSLLLQKGIVQTMDEAFDRYLGRGKPAYVEKPVIPAQTALEVIRSAGGVSILAHPGLIEIKNPKPFDLLIRELILLGLDGIEVFYPNHTDSQTSYFTDIAKKFNLLATGGTDFHGAVSPDIALGAGRGDFCVPFSVYETLKKVLNKQTPWI